jgi:hypothetical protein
MSSEGSALTTCFIINNIESLSKQTLDKTQKVAVALAIDIISYR